MDIEQAKSGEYVLGQLGDKPEYWQGRWFVVRYIGPNDWALFPGYSVGDNCFARFMPLPSPLSGKE